MRYLTDQFYGVEGNEGFGAALRKAVDALKPGTSVFAGDNLITFSKTMGFLRDPKLFAAYKAHLQTRVEHSLVWRIATVAWGAKNALRLDGDFVECACYRGTTARVICDYVDFGSLDRRYWLYDLFEVAGQGQMPEHGESLFSQVKARFPEPNVTITKGSVPQVLAETAPEKIAFFHLDLNDAEAEIGALEALWDRMVPGAALILDDYGWGAYWKQKVAEDAWFAERGYSVLELPTGQGLVIR